MRVATLTAPDDFEGWRDAARTLAVAGVPAEEVVWQVGEAPADLFGDEAVLEAPGGPAFGVPRAFVDLARTAVLHSDPERFALLYVLLTRLRGAPKLMEDRADPLVRRLEEMAKAVRRDTHKMRAFLRFREVAESLDDGGAGARFVAWFEPEHHIVRANASFFVNRFTTMRWSILTPEVSLHWDGETLNEGPGASKADAPEGDPTEEVWKTYYASIFNPARVKIGAMLKEMPRKYWKNMPETALVPELIAGAQARESAMVERSRAAVAAQSEAAVAAQSPAAVAAQSEAAVAAGGVAEAERVERRLEPGGNAFAAWDALMREAKGCTRCPLHGPATQTVFGEGPVDAALMLVGEQPGDQEDLAGRPFVGPAGQVLDRALTQAGVDRATTYVTNAVKHFKFEPRGKRRIHSKPDAGEITACRWWIEQELALVKPEVTVALGASAARSLLGRAVTIGRERGRAIALASGGVGWVTVHPSYLLRIDDKARAEDEFGRFVEDLKAVRALLA